jgi:uncharacterized protein YjbI with pentapeptide repeats
MADKQFSQKPWLIPLLAIAGVIVFGALVTGVFYFSQQQVAPLRSRIEALDRIKPNNFPELEKLAQQQKALIDAENAVRAPLIQAMVGVLATIATSTAAFIAFQNYRATQEKNTADRFSKAVEMLGHEKLDVCLGGIFALEQIANTEDKYYWQIMEILTAYVRVRSVAGKITEDIQAVMILLGRRRFSYQKGEDLPLDLNGANLRNLRLPPNAQLQGVQLRNACLTDAQLQHANLNNAQLQHANLNNAQLQHANLNNAQLQHAQLEDAYLDDAFLQGTNLLQASLRRAHLERTHLEAAKLYDANCEEAILIEAFLNDAHLNKAQMGRACLDRAHLTSTILVNVNLSETSLCGADCQWADFTGAKFQNTNFDQAILGEINVIDGHDAIGLPPEELGVVSYDQAVLASYLRQANSPDQQSQQTTSKT